MTIKYRARCDFVIERDGISVEISKGSIWLYIGCVCNKVVLCRQNARISIQKNRMDTLFRELKEQR